MEKFTPKIKHTFEIEEELLNELEFNIKIKNKDIKKKPKIVEIKKIKKNHGRKQDPSTRLF